MIHDLNFQNFNFITTRCYAERGIAMALLFVIGQSETCDDIDCTFMVVI